MATGEASTRARLVGGSLASIFSFTGGATPAYIVTLQSASRLVFGSVRFSHADVYPTGRLGEAGVYKRLVG